MSFTAEEYRTAAKVIREEYNVVPDDLTDKADKLEALEKYGSELAMTFRVMCSPTYNGAVLIKKLLGDGWTPPEGLF